MIVSVIIALLLRNSKGDSASSRDQFMMTPQFDIVMYKQATNVKFLKFMIIACASTGAMIKRKVLIREFFSR